MKIFLLTLYAYFVSLLTIAILKSKLSLTMLIAILIGIIFTLLSKENQTSIK